MTLLVLAAGMGSRYGGLKQLDPMGPGGELLLDYSVYDALRAGFRRLVFVIRPEFEEVFRKQVMARYEGFAEICVVFQVLEDLPAGMHPPEGRKKPWGTGHAIWSARSVIPGPFLAINADDFYGAEAFVEMAKHLMAGGGPALVAYELGRTLSDHGEVSRGVCVADTDGFLRSVEEHTQIGRGRDGEITGRDSSGTLRCLDPQTPVSLNFWGLPACLFPDLERLFRQFLEAGGLQNLEAEFYIPSAINALLREGRIRVAMLKTRASWQGVTYREDRSRVAQTLAELTAQAVYPSPLFSGR